MFRVPIPDAKIHKLGQQTLHKYPKEKILDSLKSYIQNGAVDNANLLTTEVICSGGYLQFWDLVIEVIAENLILILTPKLANWILEEYRNLNSLRSKVHSELPNNQEARNHIAQIVTVLCLVPKNKLTMPVTDVKVTLDDQKSKYLAEEYYLLSSPSGSQNDLVKLKNILYHFIYHMEKSQAKYCLYWINQIILLKNVKIRPFSTFKSPKSISENPIWIIWNYIFIRISEDLKEFLEQIITLFTIALSRKNYDVATFFAFSGILIIKYQKQIKWDGKIPIQNPICIRTVGKINFIYQHLTEKIPTLL